MNIFCRKASRLLFTGTLVLCLCSLAHAEQIVRVASEDNLPISMVNDRQEGLGLAMDVLRYAADKEEWKIVFVSCEWQKCLHLLQEGEIDVLTGMAPSPERAQLYDLSRQAIAVNWGTLYASRGKAEKISTFLDLDGLRVAMKKDNIHQMELENTLAKFGVKIDPVYAPSFAAAFEAAQQGMADVVLTNRFFGLMNADRYHFETTHILFNPVELKFAFPKGQYERFGRALDTYIAHLKEDRSSVYYSSLERWLGIVPTPQHSTLPLWVLGIGGMIILLGIGHNQLLRVRVRERTKLLEREIAERRQTEKALLESENKYRSLFEESKDIVTITTPEGKFIDINPAGIKLFGAAYKNEFIEKTRAQDIYADPAARSLFIAHMNESGYVIDFETKLKRTDGSIINVLIDSTAGIDEQGQTIYRSILRDVTERKLLESQLVQAQKMEAVGQLAGGIAHDFNNILSIVKSFAFLLKKKVNNQQPASEYLSEILDAADRANTLTKSLLAFSRKQVYQPVTFTLNAPIKKIEAMLRRSIGEDIDLQIILPKQHIFVHADPVHLDQILVNLATNARDAMPSGGLLTITLSAVVLDEHFIRTHGFGTPGNYARITVSDNGVGMDSQTCNRIFEPFFTTKPVGQGTGLGLAMVYGIVKQNNGYITVTSRENNGTSFDVYLPEHHETIEPLQPSEHQTPLPGHETILLVEDETSLRKATRRVLEDYGYMVIEAANGKEALEMFIKHQNIISLVIMDVIMPQKSGKEAYDEIRAIAPEAKVIFMSGYPDDILSRQNILEPDVQLMLKPIAPEVLLKKIRGTLDKPQRVQQKLFD